MAPLGVPDPSEGVCRCVLMSQRPAYNSDTGECPKCQRVGTIHYNGGDLYCVQCSSHVLMRDKSVTDLYIQVAAMRDVIIAWTDLVETIQDELRQINQYEAVESIEVSKLQIMRGTYKTFKESDDVSE